jgi:hypothetical protein
MAVKLSTLRAGGSLPPGRFLVLIYVRSRVKLSAMVRLEGLGKFNIYIYSFNDFEFEFHRSLFSLLLVKGEVSCHLEKIT